jgi:iron complex transport system substrate-binding protein
MKHRALVACLTLGIATAAEAQLPSRIVSSSPSVTEVLFALDLGDRVVGVSTYCRYPAAVEGLPDIGTFLRPNVELIARLRPDLAVVSRVGNDVPRQLTVLGIRSLTVDAARTLGDVYAMVRALGRAAGVEPRAAALIAEIEARLDRVRADAGTRRPQKVLLIIGRSPGSLTDLVAVGRGSYLNELVSIAGGVNVLSDPALPDYPRISMETVIRLDPDVIVDAGDMGDTVAEHERRQPVTEGLWRRQTLLTAARTGAVHAVTSDAFVVPGPRVVEAAEILARWLQTAGER